MSHEKTLTFYLKSPLLERAQKADVNVVNQIAAAVQSVGFRTEIRASTDAEYLGSATTDGYSMFHMEHPFHERALTMRRSYVYPYWRIENTGQRWDWPVAKADFDPTSVDPVAAQVLTDKLRSRVFGDPSVPNTSGGYVYMPLQGRLLEHRSFQAMSPIDMIGETARRLPDHDIKLTLHPKETYNDLEKQALNDVLTANPRLSLSKAGVLALLQGCDLVVTQNSSIAIQGFLLHKPAVLFGEIDFHHIAGSVPNLGLDDAFVAATQADRLFDRYLYWFLETMSLNLARNDAQQQILQRLRQHGWPV